MDKGRFPRPLGLQSWPYLRCSFCDMLERFVKKVWGHEIKEYCVLTCLIGFCRLSSSDFYVPGSIKVIEVDTKVKVLMLRTLKFVFVSVLLSCLGKG